MSIQICSSFLNWIFFFWLLSFRNSLPILEQIPYQICDLQKLSPNLWVIISMFNNECFILVQFSYSVMFNSLWPHELQHARLPCPSPTPGAYSNSCPLNQWCHRTIWSSVVPFSSHLQSFLHHGLFKWVTSSYQVAKVLEFQLQHQSFQEYIKAFVSV